MYQPLIQSPLRIKIKYTHKSTTLFSDKNERVPPELLLCLGDLWFLLGHSSALASHNSYKCLMPVAERKTCFISSLCGRADSLSWSCQETRFRGLEHHGHLSRSKNCKRGQGARRGRVAIQHPKKPEHAPPSQGGRLESCMSDRAAIPLRRRQSCPGPGDPERQHLERLSRSGSLQFGMSPGPV